METKQITITPPEGYEIDKENSSFECIKFKKKVLDITYDEVVNKIFLGKRTYYFSNNGLVEKLAMPFTENNIYKDPNNAPSKEQLCRILAINQLFNIAKYYNGDWKPTAKDNGWIIDGSMSDGLNGYHIGGDSRFTKAFPRFRNRDDAWAVINNPNFRPILDAIFK